MSFNGFRLLLLALAGAFLLIACGDDQAAEFTPTTPVDFVNLAARNTKNIKSYRLNYTSEVSASGMAEPISETLTGDFSGPDTYYRYTGPANVSINLEPHEPVEVAIVQGKSYVHGPVDYWGAPEDRWYIYSVNVEAQLTPPSRVDILIELLTRRDLRLAFTKAGSEPVGSLSCDRYNAEHDTTIALINELAHPSTLTDVEKAIVQATPESYFSVWVCPDGFIHKIDVDVHGTDPNEQEQTYRLLLEVSEVDKLPALTPPPGAIETEKRPTTQP